MTACSIRDAGRLLTATRASANASSIVADRSPFPGRHLLDGRRRRRDRRDGFGGRQPAIVQRRHRFPFPHVIRIEAHEHARAKQRRQHAGRVEAFDLAVEGEGRRGVDDCQVLVQQQKPGGGRAIVRQGHEHPAGIPKRDPGKVAAGARQQARAHGSMDGAEASGAGLEEDTGAVFRGGQDRQPAAVGGGHGFERRAGDWHHPPADGVDQRLLGGNRPLRGAAGARMRTRVAGMNTQATAPGHPTFAVDHGEGCPP